MFTKDTKTINPQKRKNILKMNDKPTASQVE